ncbi:site-specific integrase [candidate division WOR-3 bacterium]|nr:site-specific integrase [candidate division WOR-3 bacterium]
MSVFKRGGKWCIGYSLNDRWVRKTIGTSKKLAELAEKEIKLKIAKGELLGIIERKRILFQDLCTEYLQYSRANKTIQSHRRDRVSIRNLLVPFGDRFIHQITARDLEHYKNRRKDKVTPATVNRELSCIKHMFNKAVEWGHLPDNQLRPVMKFKEPPGRMRYLQNEEISRLLNYCADHLKPIVIMALNTGMRKGEILNLTWGDVNLKNRMITITNSKNNSSRIIPINDATYGILVSLGQQIVEQYVFSHPDGKPYRDIKDGFTAAVNRAKLSDVRFHDLRHTFASHLVMNGVPILEVQKLLGHKTLAMTMRYSHLSNKNLRDAVDKLDFSGYNGSEDRTNTAHRALADD